MFILELFEIDWAEVGAKVYGLLRKILFLIDSLGLTFIDDAYDLMISAITAFNEDKVAQLANDIAKNCYIIIGIFALFRIAVILVNTIIDPDKLTDKSQGFGNVLTRLVITLILFVAVPFIFDMSRKLQAEIVDNSYISKILIGTDLTGGSSSNVGTTVKDIAVRSLIYPDEEFYDKKTEEIKCTDACETAIKNWQGNASYEVISYHLPDYVMVDDSAVYVYKYTPIIVLLVGGFITYVLFSFAIDIAIRSVELAVLEILSPMFLVTYIDPKSSSSGPFKKWLTACGKTYLNLFIKIAIICLMLLFISKLNEIFDTTNDSTGLLQLLVYIAILIFAKRAPKWLGDMLGIDGSSLGGLGIGKKLGEMAGIGGITKKGIDAGNKAGRAMAGAASGAVKNLHNESKNRRALRKQARKDNGLTHLKQGHLARKGYDGGYFSQRKQLHDARRKAYKDVNANLGSNVKKGAAAVGTGFILGGQAGIKADKLNGAITGAFKAADGFANRMAMRHNEGVIDRVKDRVKRLPGMMEKAYGTSNELYDKRETQAKKKKVLDWTEKGEFGVQDVGTGKGKIIAGQKDANIVCDAISENKQMGGVSTKSFAAAQYAINQGYATVDDVTGKIDLSKVKLSADGVSYEFGDDKKPVKIEDLEKNLAGIMDSSSAGMANQAKMVNTYQTTALNNYQQNEQMKAQEISSYQTAQNESDNIQRAITGLTMALGGLGLTLDVSSASGIKDSIEKGLFKLDERLTKLGDRSDELASKERKELKELRKTIEENQVNASKIESKETFDAVAASSLANIEVINNAQASLRTVVDSIKGTTISEKTNQLSIEEKKISDRISGLVSKDDEKK